MRRLFVFLLMLSSYSVFSQYPCDHRRDNIWMFGYENSPPNFGGTCLNFNQNPLSVSYVSQQISIDIANASISDTNGNLLFYTNAMYVANSNHQIMPHGDSINYGDLYNYFGYYGYTMPQGALILPLPGSPNYYYIFHEKLEFSAPYFDLTMGFYCSIVNMDLDGGLGDVELKNVLLLNDTLDYGCITATRHANGRDWWIIVPEFKHNRYYRFLFCAQGIFQDSIQTIGTASIIPELSQSCFSPDGSKYVRWGGASLFHPYRLEVFDFDRCTGTLSNYRNLWYQDSAYACGVAISPNSRFMYVSADQRIDQYDLLATDIASTRQIVAIYDGFTDPLFPAQTRFFLMQSGYDNKIYVCTPGTTRFLHVIDQPNNEGISCNVLQHSIHLNTFNSSSIPNFPNFRLGPIDGTICDSLGINVITSNSDIQKEHVEIAVWPNPAQDYFNYKLNNQEYSGTYHLRLYNTSGILFKEWEFKGKQGFGHYSIEDIQAGVYLLTLTTADERALKTVKLIVLR